MSNYNMTGLSEANNILDIIGFTNDLSGGWFVSGIIIVLFLVITIGLIRSQNFIEESIAASSAVSLIISLLLLLAELVAIQLVYFFGFVLVAAIIALYMKGGRI